MWLTATDVASVCVLGTAVLWVVQKQLNRSSVGLRRRLVQWVVYYTGGRDRPREGALLRETRAQHPFEHGLIQSWRSLSSVTTAITTALISSRLDYANSVLYGSLFKTLLVYREPKTMQQELLHKNHHTCLQSIHSMNSTGSQFNAASRSSPPPLPSRLCTLVLHFTSHVFLFLTVLLVFSVIFLL